MAIPRTQRGGWPYSQPPNVQFDINRASPQVKGLAAWWMMLSFQGATQYVDMIRNLALSPTGTPEWLIDPERAAGLDFDSAVPEYLEGAVPSQIIDIPCTITAWCRLNLGRVTTFDIHTPFCITDPALGFARGVLLFVVSRAVGVLRFQYAVGGVQAVSPDLTMPWDTLVHVTGVSISVYADLINCFSWCNSFVECCPISIV